MKAGSLALLAFFFWAGAVRADPVSDEAVWKRIAQGGVAVMIRHARTEPGTGDPPNFRLGDCSTQRNLSNEGRAQARRLGAAFAARGIAPTAVLSSQWCRCIDTAREAFGRNVEEPALNSFFDERRTEPAQSAAVRARIAALNRGEVVVLVTHQVNMTAIAGAYPAEGELFVLAPSGKTFELVGRLPSP